MASTRTYAAEVLAAAPRQLLIGGRWHDATHGVTFQVTDPATGDAIADVADAQPEDGVAALGAAASAQAQWAATPPRTRAELLRAAWELTTERAEELATIITLEMGKPLAESRGEVIYGAEFLRWFSEEAAHINGRYQKDPGNNLRILVTKRPVGPSLFITPWNFPLAMATRKVAPALAAGCTVILKPSDLTPLTALAFGRILQDVGFPEGVVPWAGHVTELRRMTRRNVPRWWLYWGYILFGLLVFSVWNGSIGAGTSAVMTALLAVYVLFQAPVWCGAENRSRGDEVEYCRNNSYGLLVGCWIRKHKWEKLKTPWWGSRWREHTRGLWAGPAAKLATVTGLIGTVTGIWGVIKG